MNIGDDSDYDYEADFRDAERYRWLRNKTSAGHGSPGSPATFHLPMVRPVGNIMKGSVAQHLDEAIDKAMAALPSSTSDPRSTGKTGGQQ